MDKRLCIAALITVVARLSATGHLVDFRRARRGGNAFGAWGFYLPSHNGWIRLPVHGGGNTSGHAVFDIADFDVEQKMMRGIHDRVHQTRRRRITKSIAPQVSALQTAA